MPPEEGAAPAEAQDKPQDEGAPEEGQAPEKDSQESESFDYKQGYEELRPAYTQATMREAQYRTIVEAAANPSHPQHAEALEYLGIEFETEEDDDEDDDPTTALKQDVEEIRNLLQERDQEQEQQRYEEAETDWLASQIGALQEKENVEFDDHELKLLVSAATSNRLDDGQPDLEGAYTVLKGAWDARQKAWRASKNAPQAPSGASASTDVNLDDAEQRREYLARRMAELA